MFNNNYRVDFSVCHFFVNVIVSRKNVWQNDKFFLNVQFFLIVKEFNKARFSVMQIWSSFFFFMFSWELTRFKLNKMTIFFWTYNSFSTFKNSTWWKSIFFYVYATINHRRSLDVVKIRLNWKSRVYINCKKNLTFE